MQEFLSQDKAKQWIKFIASFCKDPVGFSYEDWKDWRPRIERARGVVRDEDLKYIATNTIIFFDEYYSLTKKFKPNFVHGVNLKATISFWRDLVHKSTDRDIST